MNKVERTDYLIDTPLIDTLCDLFDSHYKLYEYEIQGCNHEDAQFEYGFCQGVLAVLKVLQKPMETKHG